MHELSIVQSLLQGLAQESAQFGPGRISEIHLQVGAASGVSLEALQFAFEAVSPHSLAAGAVLQIDLVPLIIQCTTCKHQQQMDQLSLVCPACGGPANLISGRELLIKRYTFEDDDSPQNQL